MKLSKYFFKTVKEVPKDAQLNSHKLLIRGGYIKQIGAGIFSYMPIAVRVLQRIENIIREEMNRINGLEVNLPVVMPASLWMESGRYETTGEELLRFEDRTKRKMILGMTHEEAVTDLARWVITSYKQLPAMLYQIQTKFRDEPRVRGGLIRVREFVMKDAYSFHSTTQSLEAYYKEVHQAYERIFKRTGLSAISVASDVGMMGGSGAHEFMALAKSGEDTLIICDNCDYKANKEVATCKREYPKEPFMETEDVHTPSMQSIEEVATFLKVSTDKTLKTIVYQTDTQLVMCVIRGDLDVNETKLRNYLKAKFLIFADDETLQKQGLVKGFLSPVGIKNMRVIVDESARFSPNLVAGANKKDYHTKNVNFGRDYSSEEVVDIANVNENDICPQCGKPSLTVKRGIEVGNIFKLGTKYSSSMKAEFLDENGKAKNLIMGCYGIGVGRLMASVIETNENDNKIIWPISIAPFEVEIIGLGISKDEKVKGICETLYGSLQEKGIDTLYDDRNASAGIKFNDGDLFGAPIKVTIGNRSLQKGGVELKINDKEGEIIATDKIVEKIIEIRETLFKELENK